MLLVYILTAPACLCSKELLEAFLPCLVSPIGPLLCAARKAALMVPKKIKQIKNIYFNWYINLSYIGQQDDNLAGCYSSPNWSRSQLWSPKSVKLNGTTVTLPTQKGETCPSPFSFTQADQGTSVDGFWPPERILLPLFSTCMEYLQPAPMHPGYYIVCSPSMSTRLAGRGL